MPLLTVYLREEAGLNFMQIGWAMALTNVPLLISPVLLTLLADRQFDPRRIMAVSYFCSSLVLMGIFLAQGVVLTLVLFVFHGLFFVGMLPLQDGFYFSYAKQLRDEGKLAGSYPLVRLWGTIGFIIPSVVIWLILSKVDNSGLSLIVAVVFCLLSLLNSFFLPKVNNVERRGGSIPTSKALGTIFSKHGRWLAIGLFVAFMSSSTFYATIGNYFSEEVNIPAKYIGLIINIGVFLEIFYTML
ncbi:MAG: MFS transporter, partial [Verrucomicrobiota bacterium]